MSPPHEPDLAAITALLRRWIEERLDADAAAWATAGIDELAATPADARLYRLFGEVHGRCGAADLAPSAADLAAADAARPGWDPRDWSIGWPCCWRRRAPRPRPRTAGGSASGSTCSSAPPTCGNW
jgi:hypothetical protein